MRFCRRQPGPARRRAPAAQQFFRVKDAQNACSDLLLRGDRHLGQHIAAAVGMNSFCRSEPAKTASMRSVPLRRRHRRRPAPGRAARAPVRMPDQASVDAAPPGPPDKHWLAIGGDAPRRAHRLTPRAGVHLEHGLVQKQVVQVEVIRPPRGSRRQLLANGPAHRLDRPLA